MRSSLAISLIAIACRRESIDIPKTEERLRVKLEELGISATVRCDALDLDQSKGSIQYCHALDSRGGSITIKLVTGDGQWDDVIFTGGMLNLSGVAAA